jgi:hypothetical protein
MEALTMKIYSIVLLFLALQTQNTSSFIGASELSLKDRIVKALSVRPLDSASFAQHDVVLAGPVYQALGQEAQAAAGIPSDKQLPIRIMPTQVEGFEHLALVTNSDAIYVNEELNNACSYGSKRHSMFHEAMHIKYHDVFISASIPYILLPLDAIPYLAGYCLTLECSGSSSVPQLFNSFFFRIVTVLGSIPVMKFLQYKFLLFSERRADTKAAYACMCGPCVAEAAESRFSVNDQCCEAQDDRNKGYLTKEELYSIANTLNTQSLVCKHHQCNRFKDSLS